MSGAAAEAKPRVVVPATWPFTPPKRELVVCRGRVAGSPAHIREVPGSNTGTEGGHPDRGFSRSLSSSRRIEG